MSFAARLLPLLLAIHPVLVSTAASQDVNLGAQVVVQSGNQQEAQVIADGAGGAFVVWQDSRSNVHYDIYAQRIDDTGNVLWNTSGVPVCTAPTDQSGLRIAQDGQGGVIVVWRDPRSGSPDIYAQRLDDAGRTVWAFNGVPLCQASNVQEAPEVFPDGSGGAVVTWHDLRSNEYDIYAQRLGANGLTQWTVNGVNLTVHAAQQLYPVIAGDGAGGSIVAWQDSRNGSYDIYAQRLSPSGVPQWQQNGIEVCAAPGEQRTPRVIQDGAGGAVFMWEDLRNGPAHIYSQRLNAGGVNLWTVNGVGILTSASGSSSPRMTTDGSGGAIIAWQDWRNGASNYDIFAQRIPSSGVPSWTGNGVAVCAVSGNQHLPQIVRDGAGGTIITWYDERSGSNGQDVYAQSLSAAGAVLWPADGEVIVSSPAAQIYPVLAEDGSGGGIVVWQDNRYGITGYDLFAQRIVASEQLVFPDAEHPVLKSVRDTPNDQGGRVKLSWRGSNRDLAPIADVAEYRIWRSVPPNLAAKRLSSSDLMKTEFAGTSLYWEYVASQPAGRLTNYSYVATTTSDSLPDSNPYTHFMVEARSANGSLWWHSNPDSGYSVDNLPPSAPSGLSGTYAAETGVSMHWNKGGEPDLAHYVVHRGPTANFVPDAGNEIGVTPDTMFVDATGAFNYYKVAAVDVHANRGPFATLASEDIPVGTLLSLMLAESEGASIRILVRLSQSAGAMRVRILRGVDSDLGSASELRPAATSIEGEEYIFTDTDVVRGQTYWYWAELHEDNGPVALAGPVSAGLSDALITFVGPAYPNPATSETVLAYTIGSDVAHAGSVRVKIEIYDIRGRVVRSLVDEDIEQGLHRAVWDGRGDDGRERASGLYYWRFQAGHLGRKGSVVLIR